MQGIKDFLTQPLFEGLPLELMPWQVLYVIVLFLVTVWMLDRVLYRPVLGIMEERQRKIEEDAKAAGSSDAEIDEKSREITSRLAAARSEAVARLESAKAEAEKTRGGKLAEARSRADERLAAARAEVELAGAAAEEELRRGAEALARTITTRLIGREVA